MTTIFNRITMNELIAFGQPVPKEVINELLEEGYKEEEITTEFLETLYFYEHLDNE